MTEVLALLILLTVIAAIITVVTPNLLYSVISLGAVGFLLAIVFLFLAAPDIVIVQIGVEVVTLVILIRATLGRDKQMVKVSRPLVGMTLAMALVAVIGLFGVHVFNDFPPFGAPVMERFSDAPATTYLQDGLEPWVKRPCCSALRWALRPFCGAKPGSSPNDPEVTRHERQHQARNQQTRA